MYLTILQRSSPIMILGFSLLVACDAINKAREPISMCGTVLPGSYQMKYRAIMEEMHRGMEQVIVVQDDKVNYLRQMIPHHQGAIEMSELIIGSTTDHRIINIARGIITEQRNEIAIMHHLICELEAETVTN